MRFLARQIQTIPRFYHDFFVIQVDVLGLVAHLEGEKRAFFQEILGQKHRLVVRTKVQTGAQVLEAVLGDRVRVFVAEVELRLDLPVVERVRLVENAELQNYSWFFTSLGCSNVILFSCWWNLNSSNFVNLYDRYKMSEPVSSLNTLVLRIVV